MNCFYFIFYEEEDATNDNTVDSVAVDPQEAVDPEEADPVEPASVKANPVEAVDPQKSSFTPCSGAFHILDLPQEILLPIFKYLPLREAIAKISRVCKHFRKLVNSATMWSVFRFLNVFGCIVYNKNVFDNIFSHAHQLKQLYFNQWRLQNIAF